MFRFERLGCEKCWVGVESVRIIAQEVRSFVSLLFHYN